MRGELCRESRGWAWIVWEVLGAGLLVAACGEEDVPSSSRFTIERTLEDCAFASHAIEPDEQTPFGVSAGELARWVVGEHRGPLEWQHDGLALGPEVGVSEIALRVEQRDGLRWIESRLENPQGREVYCSDSLVLPVRLHLSTAGGALDETVETTLLASSRDVVSGSVLLPTDGLRGTFFTDPALPTVGTSAPALILTFDLLPYAQKGMVQYDRGQHADGLYDVAPIAYFPPLGTCPGDQFVIDPVQSVHDVSRADVLAWLNGDSLVTIGPGPTTLQLSFEDTGEPGCAASRPADGITAFDFPARATLRSSDGRVDGNVSVEATAVLDTELTGVQGEHRLAHVNAERSSFHESPAEATAAAGDYAILEPLDFSGYPRQYFDFSHQVREATRGGWLRAIGLRPGSPPCERTPDPRTNCQSPTEVFVLRWGNRELLPPTPFAPDGTLP